MNRPLYRKALGQHHLRSGADCSPLLGFLQVEGESVLEVGPGGGVLTAELLQQGAKVTAWELDPAWAMALRQRSFGSALQIVVGDVLTLPWEGLEVGTLVAGNLPYNIASKVILDLLGHAATIPRAAFLVQLEVARRLVAKPGESDYGSLSVLAALRAEVEFLGKVARERFRPPPKVDGGFVGCTLRELPVDWSEWSNLEVLVRLAFGLRRKTLLNALSVRLERQRVAEVLERLQWPPTSRAENLAVADFLSLHRQIESMGLLRSARGRC